MHLSATREMRRAHFAYARDTWPKTGPIYGFDEDTVTPRAKTLWQRIGERFGKSPDGDNEAATQARIWY